MARRRPARVDGRGLADNDGRLGGQQPALGFVHRTRHTVEARREVKERRPAEAVVAVPARRFGERVVDLHLRPPEAKAACGQSDRGGKRHIPQQSAVQLRRQDVADDRPCGELVSVHGSNTARAAVLDENSIHLAIRLQHAAVIADQLRQRVDEPRTAAARNRHAAQLDRDGDHLRHEAGGGSVRAETGVQHPRREEPVRAPGPKRLRQPVAGRLDELAAEGHEPAPAEPPVCLQR